MKRRQNITFLVFCSLLTIGLVWTFGTFNSYFSGRPENSVWVENAMSQAKLEKYEVVRLKNQLKDLQFNTAIALKDSSQSELSKKLLETTRAPASESEFDLSEVLFQKAKAEFDGGRYRNSARGFSQLIESYPLSGRMPEAYFFLGESDYRLGKYKDMLEIIDIMVEQFPESDLTGFLLLRQVQLSINTHQLDEAREICQIIKDQYKNPTLLEQVANLEKVLQL